MEPLTVQTYNVRHAVLDDGPDAWDRRFDGVLGRIESADPDVLGLQECEPRQHADLAAELSAYEWRGVADDPASGANNPIAAGPRLSVRSAETVWLSESGDVGSVGWDGGYARVLTSARLRDRSAGRDFVVYNTHFDHVGRRARMESATLLRERIDALPDGRPAIAMGDFNTVPGDDVYERLCSGAFRRSLVDTRRVASAIVGPETTLSNFTSLQAGRQLDHVFVTPDVSVERHTVDEQAVDGRYPSDHLPVSVALSVRD
jgi:endonuclease/exonuclease/phosphatase family metal-dependent hydrolase